MLGGVICDKLIVRSELYSRCGVFFSSSSLVIFTVCTLSHICHPRNAAIFAQDVEMSFKVSEIITQEIKIPS